MKTLVFIHGMWGSTWCWQAFSQFFAQRGYQCLTPTLRYHDLAPEQAPYSELGTVGLQDYADDLAALINTLPEKPILIGHSMGGLLAQMLAERQLCQAAILLTPASPAGINALTPSVIKSFWRVQSTWSFWTKPMKLTFDEACYSILQLLPVEQQQEAYRHFVYESGQAAFEIGYWPFDLERASRVNEYLVRCPLLVVAGGQDRLTPPSVVRKVAQKYPNVATYMEFPRHAHWLIAEEGWEEIAACCEAWLTRHQ